MMETCMRHDLRHTQFPLKAPASVPTKIGTARRKRIALDASMSVTEAFAAVARGCIGYIATAADTARRSDDPEGIHQLRVGIRRLRAAFSVFNPALPRRRPAVVRQLQMLQRQLGTARELDVLLDETIASMPHELRTRREMRELIKAAEAGRVARHRRARAALASRRCTELLSQLGPAIDRYAWQRAGSSAIDERTAQPIADLAKEVMRVRHRKARKLGEQIRDLGPDELHELRIRIKKLRYAAEFFQDLWPGARSERYLRALKELQQLLGTVHDATVTTSLTAQIGKQGGTETEHAAMLVQDWANTCLKRGVGKLPDLWRRFAKRKSPWKDG
jgi:CHAD domain-containing protein